MNDRDEILVRALARADAARLPCRDYRGATNANRCAWLRSLAKNGLPLPCVGRSAAGRKAHERALTQAAKAGLAVVRNVRGERSPSVALNVAGELRARRLADLPGLPDALEFVADLAERTKREPVLFQDLWSIETTFTDGRGYGDCPRAERQLLAGVELVYVVAAARGWAASESTVPGHVFYRLKPAGWAMLEGFAEGTTPPDVQAMLDLQLPLPGESFAALYRREQDAALRELATATNDGRRERDIGQVALPVSPMNLPLTRLGFALTD